MCGQFTDTCVTLHVGSLPQKLLRLYMFLCCPCRRLFINDTLSSDPEDAEILDYILGWCGCVPKGGAGRNQLWGLLMKTFLKDKVEPKQSSSITDIGQIQFWGDATIVHPNQ